MVNEYYYNGKMVLSYDPDFFDTEERNHLYEIACSLLDRASDEFGNECAENAEKNVWNVHEKIKKIWDEIQSETKESCNDANDNIMELFTRKQQLQEKLIRKRLNEEEFELFKKLQLQSAKAYNDSKDQFYENTDYVWVDYGDGKRNPI